MYWARSTGTYFESDMILVRPHVNVLHLHYVVTPSSGSELVVQYDMGTNPPVRIVLNVYYVSHCLRCATYQVPSNKGIWHTNSLE